METFYVFHRLCRIGFVVVAVIVSLSACGIDVISGDSVAQDAADAPDGAGAAASILEQVQDAGMVRIGVRNDNPPMSFIDEDGSWVGFDLELARSVADQLGVEAELVPVDGTTRISFLESGQVDMSVASMNHTRSRDAAIDFSTTYFWDNQSFLVRTGTYGSIEELFGERVAANSGSSAIGSWNAYVADAGGEESDIVEFNDKLAAMQSLRDGAVEGYTEDNITLLALAAGDPELTLLAGGHNPVQFGIGVPENDSGWRDAVNLALQDVWTQGIYQDLYDRWFVEETRIIDLPLGGEMEVWG